MLPWRHPRPPRTVTAATSPPRATESTCSGPRSPRRALTTRRRRGPPPNRAAATAARTRSEACERQSRRIDNESNQHNVPSLIAQSNLTRSNEDLQPDSSGSRPDSASTEERTTRPGSSRNASAQTSKVSSRASRTRSGQAQSSQPRKVRSLKSATSTPSARSSSSPPTPAATRQTRLQIDSAIESITRIANTATFGGLKLLDGSQDYIVSGVQLGHLEGPSSAPTSAATTPSSRCRRARLGAARRALYVRLQRGHGRTSHQQHTLRIAGSLGVGTIEVVSGTSLANLINAVNNLKSVTGVSASLISAADPTSGIVFNSTTYGSDAFVSVERIGGPSDPAEDTVSSTKPRTHTRSAPAQEASGPSRPLHSLRPAEIPDVTSPRSSTAHSPTARVSNSLSTPARSHSRCSSTRTRNLTQLHHIL